MKKAKRLKRTFTQAKGKRGPMRSGLGGRMTIDGLPVVDAKAPLILEVNDNDVRESETGRREPGSCAAACAAMRQEHTSKAFIYRSKAYILRTPSRGKQFYERYQVPRSLRIELGAFDKGGEFEAQDFKLNRPYLSQTAGYRLTAPAKSQSLPLKSHRKKYGNYAANGSRAKAHVSVKVRPRPTGFSK